VDTGLAGHWRDVVNTFLSIDKQHYNRPHLSRKLLAAARRSRKPLPSPKHAQAGGGELPRVTAVLRVQELPRVTGRCRNY
jgi:hypothetical protein